jgi:hypothetical protein
MEVFHYVCKSSDNNLVLSAVWYLLGRLFLRLSGAPSDFREFLVDQNEKKSAYRASPVVLDLGAVSLNCANLRRFLAT